MASISTRLMTFEEFEKLPDSTCGHYELHHGELVEVAPPKHKHHRIQNQLMHLLMGPARTAGRVTMEVGYKPVPEFEYWVADFAFISHTRFDQTPAEGIFAGGPELVVEVLSPSNTVSEIRDKRKLCLENGSIEFWAADPDHCEVEVWTPDGRSITYHSGERIPLFFAPGSSIEVDAIFA